MDAQTTRRARRRGGFTLVELLVVVAIIGILLSLLLPAVQAAREAARRTDCSNNIRNLALATIQHEHSQKHFPGYRNLQAVDADGVPRSIGWGFALLPYMEEVPVHQTHGRHGSDDARGQLPNVTIPIFTCPSDQYTRDTYEDGDVSFSSYVANAGQPDRRPSMPWPADWKTNGVFIDRFGFDAEGNIERFETVKASYISGQDGLSKTLLLTENVDSGRWTDDGEYLVGIVWEPTEIQGAPAPLNVKRINEDRGGSYAAAAQQVASIDVPVSVACLYCGPIRDKLRPTAPDGGQGLLQYARPSSYHGGGVTAAFADGHVRFVRETIDYLTYCQLLTPEGAGARVAGSDDPVPEAYRSSQLDMNDL